jgi:hypothetical protein
MNRQTFLREQIAGVQKSAWRWHTMPADSGYGCAGRYVRQSIEYRRAAALWRQVDMPVCLAWTLNNLGVVESEEGSFADGQRLVEESLAIRKNWVQEH